MGSLFKCRYIPCSRACMHENLNKSSITKIVRLYLFDVQNALIVISVARLFRWVSFVYTESDHQLNWQLALILNCCHIHSIKRKYRLHVDGNKEHLSSYKIGSMAAINSMSVHCIEWCTVHFHVIECTKSVCCDYNTERMHCAEGCWEIANE